MSRGRIAELAAVLVVAALGFGGARATFLQGTPIPFYQNEFGPAVMMASGHGFVNPQVAPGGALDDFLRVRTASLAPEAALPTATAAFTQFQHAHRYLISAVGWWWRLTNVAWARMAEVVAALHVLGILAVYALIRLFAPAAPALAGALVFALSPLQLSFVLMPRDFSKGPFILAIVPLLAAIVTRTIPMKAAVWLSAAAGMLIGIGQGFKMDVAIMLPIAIGCITLFHGARPWLALRSKAACVAALLLAFTLTAWPIISKLSSGGSNVVHVILLGYSEWFDSQLGIVPAPYTLSPFYSDAYLRNVIQSRASDRSGLIARMPSAEYDAASTELWLQWLRHFPADAYTRLLAAVDGTLNTAFRHPALNLGPGHPTQRLAPLFAWLSRWSGWGWLLGVTLIFAAARTGARAALFLTALVMALAGYPSLQYDPRHFFHLQAIPIAAIVILVWAILRAGVRVARAGAQHGPGVAMRWRLALTAAIVAGVWSPAVFLRAYQERHLAGVFDELSTRPRQKLDVEFTEVSPNRFQARWPELQGQPTHVPGLYRAYYVAEFHAGEPRSVMAIGLRFVDDTTLTGCAYARALQATGGLVRFAFPAYSLSPESSFDGLEIGPEMRKRFAGLYRLESGPAGLPIYLQLSPDWRDRRLYQRLTPERRWQADDSRIELTSTAERCGSEVPLIDATLAAGLQPAASQVAKIYSQDVRVDAAGVVLDGTTNGELATLIEFKPLEMQVNDVLTGRVWLGAGSITIALVKNGTWVRYVNLVRPGAGIVIMRAPESGRYSILIASADPDQRADLRFTLDRLGIVKHEEPSATR